MKSKSAVDLSNSMFNITDIVRHLPERTSIDTASFFFCTSAHIQLISSASIESRSVSRCSTSIPFVIIITRNSGYRRCHGSRGGRRNTCLLWIGGRTRCISARGKGVERFYHVLGLHEADDHPHPVIQMGLWAAKHVKMTHGDVRNVLEWRAAMLPLPKRQHVLPDRERK